ncbi:MAG: CoA transferase, partial [Actinomycetota bacterium]|nr:CoA transferase [Actinomycetota bacterium]
MRDTRVLDLSDSIMGAYAAHLLAGVGSHVTVAEPPGGSTLRQAPPLLDLPEGSKSASWAYLSSGKHLHTIDPGNEIEAAVGYDAVVLATDGPSSAVGQLAERLRTAHPGLVVATMTPYGLTGPQSSWRAGPLEHWALGGHLMLNGELHREPIPGGGPWVSHLVGAVAAVAIQGALLRAQSTGQGSLIDVGALEALASSHQWTISMFTHTGAVKHRAGNRHGEMHHPLNLYQCLDGHVCIAAASFHQWEGLCIAMDRVELLADDGLAYAAHRYDRRDELDEAVTAWTSQHTVAQVVEACQTHFCPAGRVGDFTDMLRDPQLAHRSYLQPVPDLGPTAVMSGLPFR